MTPHAMAVVREIASVLAATLCVTAATYYIVALRCARKFFRPRRAAPTCSSAESITILKPVCGLDRGAYENFASFCRQRYPAFQIVFGSERADDPGLAVARRVARDFPGVDVRFVVHTGPATPNPKVGLLAALAAQARYPLLLVSDSDIRVGPHHLRTLVGPMADSRVGVVTCLYRSQAKGFAGCLDALGLTTDFQPSVLVARELEGISFGMGSGTLVRAAALAAGGGFEAIGDFLADDYLLGHLPVRAGYRAELAHEVVEHELDVTSLAQVVRHQIRWNRGIRAMRPRGYAGLMLTQGVPASLLLIALAGALPHAWALVAATIGLRFGMAWFVGVRCLKDDVARRALWLLPLRDLMTFGLWVTGFFGSSVVWRGRRLWLASGGRLRAEAPASAQTQPELVESGFAS
ncbi:MAG TPA: bacteriohopanetetrol glucosamine biosynthesis glycosyltransferase HpnI [Thermoanaerobaculia bacterium]|jgi:ceramide glucosyltransferase|nr:bacteriohopanetetrol glucosamine biosynthesis glycosyltransferase HpnI [Thermoanaerobaculia bacterium]